jgi:hypothetical protein
MPPRGKLMLSIRVINIKGKDVDEESFKLGFTIGWAECYGHLDKERTKMTQIGDAAAENYVREHSAKPK